jgi:citrate lyase beta subunit
MSNGRIRYARVRSILEVPILNEKYWSKIPTAKADAIMLDLEDSATPANKELVRQKIVEVLKTPEYFGGRQIIVRINNLATPWGRHDLSALSGVDGEFLICYPKAESAEEVTEVLSLMSPAHAKTGLYVMVETARAMVELDRIASCQGVVGLHFGYVDYAADVGSRPFNEAGDYLFEPVNYYAQTKIAVAAAAYGLFATGGTLIPDFKNLEQVRRFVQRWADLGYTGCVALSPAHLDCINEVMAPSEAAVKAATNVCTAYEDAVNRGDPAAVIDGKVITNPDYRVAKLTLTRAGVWG